MRSISLQLKNRALAGLLAKEATARDFVADAFAHLKFIGYNKGAIALLAKAGVPKDADPGLIALDSPGSVTGFIEACRKLRLWARAPHVKL